MISLNPFQDRCRLSERYDDEELLGLSVRSAAHLDSDWRVNLKQWLTSRSWLLVSGGEKRDSEGSIIHTSALGLGLVRVHERLVLLLL